MASGAHSPPAGPAAEQHGRPFTAEQLSEEGRTAAGLAAARGDRKELLRLLQAGANPSEADGFLDTPLHLAALFGHLDCLKLLLVDYEASPDASNWEGWSPVCCAVSRGHTSVVKYLLKNGADGTWVTPHGWTLMHIAAWHNQEAMAEWLAQHGAAAGEVAVHGCRPLDVTRPGGTRRKVYHAMVQEQRNAAAL